MHVDLVAMSSAQHAQDLLKATFYVLACVALWKIVGHLLHRYIVKNNTVVYDIPNLGVPRRDESRLKGTAVICGGRYLIL